MTMHTVLLSVDVESPFGPGRTIYVTVHDDFANDIFLVACKKTGHLRHFATNQLRLSPNGTLEIGDNA
jgi:hypothetical protein